MHARAASPAQCLDMGMPSRLAAKAVLHARQSAQVNASGKRRLTNLILARASNVPSGHIRHPQPLIGNLRMMRVRLAPAVT